MQATAGWRVCGVLDALAPPRLTTVVDYRLHDMRADICDPDDEAAVERFRNVLQRLGAQLGDRGWAMGCDIGRLRIDGQELIVFSDVYSIDIEGPDDLVRRVLREYEQHVP